MSQQFDILRRLQEYEVLPPPEVVDSLFTALNKTRHEDTGKIWNGCLERLAHVEYAPPPATRSVIEQMIAGKTPLTQAVGSNQSAGSRKKVNFAYGYRAIAACFLLVFAIWAIYKANLSRKTAPIVMTTQKAAPIPAHDNSTPVAQPSDTLAQKEIAKNVPLPDTALASKPLVRLKQNPAFSVEGHVLPVTDNDLLITLASFKYNEIPAFIDRKDDEDIRIRVDAYSNIYISRSMLKMIKEMYETRSSGKPTRKAKRNKAKLEQWKKKDETRFDQSSGNNPLDPIDLARFIFK
jgi:hypothetical protein